MVKFYYIIIHNADSVKNILYFCGEFNFKCPIMEIRVYSNFDAYTNSKPLFVSKVNCLDAFSFEKFMQVFKSIYGSTIIIVFICS